MANKYFLKYYPKKKHFLIVLRFLNSTGTKRLSFKFNAYLVPITTNEDYYYL